jgi:phosphoglycolate phosphatase-like HAD superfamily hydrolase
VVIGDKASDVGLAVSFGARSILVRTGDGALAEVQCSPDAVVDDLLGAAAVVAKLVSSHPNPAGAGG